MEHIQNLVTSEAATDEPASPLNPQARANRRSDRDSRACAIEPRPLLPEPVQTAPAGPGQELDTLGHPIATGKEESAYRRGIAAGLRIAGPAQGPAAPDPDLTRDGAGPALVSADLAEAYRPVAADARGREIRHDGFTPARQRIFLAALAACGVVADACRAAGICRDTAYALRNRAEGRAFAIAWDAAILLSRGKMGDELMSRGMNGVVDRIYRNGELWGERHRHDNRLAMSILTRLDRQAAGMGEGAAVARTAAQEWDRFLDIVEAGGDGADTFLADRAPTAAEKPAEAEALESTASILARLKSYQLYKAGRADEIRTSDLDPEEMDAWTDEQWQRADLSGFLDALPEDSWPEEAREVTDDETNGTCRSRRVYRDRHPDGDDSPAPGDDGFLIWEAQDGIWMTDYPPPEGFDGDEENQWGGDDYQRTLSQAEQVAVAARLEAERIEEEAWRSEDLAQARAARDRAFGFPGDVFLSSCEPLESAPAEGQGFEQPARSDIQPGPNVREGDSG